MLLGELGGWCRFTVYLNAFTSLQQKLHRRVLEVALLLLGLVRDLLGFTVRVRFRVHD